MRAGVPPAPRNQAVVRVRGSGHRSPKRVVARVRGVSPALRQPRHPRQLGAPAHDDYLKHSGRKRFPEQQKLLGALSAQKILLYAPLLEWYLANGLKVTAVYRTIDYEPREIFSWFVKEVADNRRKGDADKDKALLAEVFKLLGNGAYGKFIEAVERQNKTLYTRDEEEVDKHLRSAWFQDLDEIGDAYKIELRKDKITITRPFQVGIVVYQLAKLRMLQFYYEFLDFYFDRRDFELIQMDTDSMYFAFARGRGTRPSSRRRRSSGWPGTSGATASPACSSSRSRPPSASPCAASASTWRTGPPGRRRFPLRGSTSARTRCALSGSSGPSRAVETWRPTGASACTTARCTRTSSASSA